VRHVGVVGRLRYVDVGFFETEEPVSERHVLAGEVWRRRLRLRPATTDKRTFGHACIVAGAASMPGAALLAAEAALRSGAGLVTACVPESVQSAFAARAPEAMWLPWPETPSGALSLDGRILFDERAGRFNALLAGPGLSRDPETHALLRLLLANHAALPLVLDADALVPDLVRGLGGRRALLTPHDGEWQRIAEAVPADAVVVRKGPRTRVVGAGRDVLIPAGGPVLARGGSGDVLAGLCVGRLAVRGDPFLAACEAAAWHAAAGDRVAHQRGDACARTADLIDALGTA
jgi:NAD(P)H-hydrate epimerase